ncbi:sugar transferase [uncultured Psychroserpens sp.]|uniref:sugar transferase n=1 Tax=uncultured Psychroserpens sp. TaxID=255436 RepID=UPI002618E9E7|nr:sugar transferase [uncultured Psychroserpens sp.]
MYKHIIKPFFDILSASIGFILLFPIFLVTWCVLMFKNNGKAFFYQERPGKNERIFKIIKFKTMNDKTDENGELLPPSERLTAAGIFVRKYSLDEIPQLLNVIKGDMSIVGPRPLLVRYLSRYNDHQKQRHNIKPGITGWAQVNGRNAISWEEKFNYDVWYVKHMSFILDIKILFLTVYKVFKKDGIYSVENDIVPDFMGTETNQNSTHGN